ncbi:hypothetical protein [Chryseolinea lacunae]|uniref:Uncharacterized protein n=1 Tax=Chryseolinea lacunae TaxID=2801331 RepID=A0ABS1KTY0_9BACT|nr:hypothetical protein [Chryseolinea lacunae]MBL0742727.1 hypothetical protein [Chryseolinea lacunae]
MRVLKWIANGVLALGLCIVVYGLVTDPGIPYQDPPPELAKRYYEEQAMANALMSRGGMVLLVGVVLKVVQWVWGYVNRAAR